MLKNAFPANKARHAQSELEASRSHRREPGSALDATVVHGWRNRQASHAITLDAVWRPGEDFGDRDTAWARGFFAALGRFREACGDSVYGRLVDVKTTYDPDNVFHHNQNIRPRSQIERRIAKFGDRLNAAARKHRRGARRRR